MKTPEYQHRKILKDRKMDQKMMLKQKKKLSNPKNLKKLT